MNIYIICLYYIRPVVILLIKLLILPNIYGVWVYYFQPYMLDVWLIMYNIQKQPTLKWAELGIKRIVIQIIGNINCFATLYIIFIVTVWYLLIEVNWRIYTSINTAIVGSDNGLSHVRLQAIILTNADKLFKYEEQTSVKFQSEFNKFKKMTSRKCRLLSSGHFVSASMCYTVICITGVSGVCNEITVTSTQASLHTPHPYVE